MCDYLHLSRNLSKLNHLKLNFWGALALFRVLHCHMWPMALLDIADRKHVSHYRKLSWAALLWTFSHCALRTHYHLLSRASTVIQCIAKGLLIFALSMLWAEILGAPFPKPVGHVAPAPIPVLHEGHRHAQVGVETWSWLQCQVCVCQVKLAPGEADTWGIAHSAEPAELWGLGYDVLQQPQRWGIAFSNLTDAAARSYSCPGNSGKSRLRP